jgi:hypothetical protein
MVMRVEKSQLLKQVLASVRRAQAKARKARKAADAFSAARPDPSSDKQTTTADARHKPAIGAKNK